MIELLVKYIEDKGYDVDVLPGILIIRKRVDALYDVCSIDWAISKHDLNPGMEEILYWEATKRMDMIDKAIAERYSCLIAGKR